MSRYWNDPGFLPPDADGVEMVPDDVLEHGDWKHHKYIARVREGGKYIYFYTAAEIAAYRASKSAGDSVDKLKRGDIRGAYNSGKTAAVEKKNQIGYTNKANKALDNFSKTFSSGSSGSHKKKRSRGQSIVAKWFGR